jgi:hypothetical protein
MVYEILTTPGETPRTMPVVPTDAIPASDDDQDPPDVEFARVIVDPEQTTPEPLIADGAAETVMVIETEDEPIE